MVVYMTTKAKGIVYNKTNNDMFFFLLKKKTPIKKIGNIYHNLVKKNLNEISGIEEVIQVINIQNKYNKISDVTGCFTTGSNNEKCLPIFKTVKIINPNKIGSVGNAISISRTQMPKSDKDKDNGVRNITKQKRYLKLTIGNKNKPIIIGNNSSK